MADTYYKFMLPEEVRFRYYNEFVHGRNLEISQDRASAMKRNVTNGGSDYGLAFLGPVNGHVEFEVEIFADNGMHAELGLRLGIKLLDKPLDRSEIPSTSSGILSTPNHHIWYGKMLHSADSTNTYQMAYGQKSLDELRKADRVGIMITSNGQLHFLVNGEPQGRVADCNVYKPGYDAYIIVDHFASSIATQITRATQEMNLLTEEIPAKYALDKGLKEGYVSLNNIKMVVCGPPCVGKTAFKNLLQNVPCPFIHHSTPIAARTVQVKRIAAGETVWKNVSEEDLVSMISATIKKLQPFIYDASPQASSPAFSQLDDQTDITKPLPKEFIASCTHTPSASSETSLILSTETNFQPHSDDTLSKKIIKKIASPEKEQRHEETWIHFLDSGGQPQFIDLLRMFMRDNSLYIIVIKATESFHDKPIFVYSIHGKQVNTPGEMTMTNLQIIETFVRSIAADSNGQSGNSRKPAFAIVATHYDKLPKKARLTFIKEANEQILKCLNEFLDLFIFSNRDSNELIFPVDNRCHINRRKISTDIRLRLLSSRPDIIINVKIPVRWYLFDLHMKKEVSKEIHGMISLESCYAIGSRLRMSKTDVDHCLVHLDSMRLCIYYPNILPHVIFTNPQFLIDCVSNIVRVSFVDDLQQILPEEVILPREAILSLKRDGIFDESLMDNLGLTFIPNLFTKSNLLSLLQFFHLISPIKAASKNTRFFIPILLPAERLSNQHKTMFATIVDPLFITLNRKPVLLGLFPVLVVSLLSRQEEPYFFIGSCSVEFPQQLRYAVKLYSDYFHGLVFLCNDYESIEVYFTGYPEHCNLLRKVILDGLSASAAVLGYDEKALNISALVRCKREHILSENDKVPHPIIIFNMSNPPAIGCSVESSIPIKALDELDKDQKCWLQGSTSSITTTLHSLPVSESAQLYQCHVPTILEAITPIVYEWEMLGLYLGISRDKLNEIKYNTHDQAQNCRKEMICHWIETRKATSGRLISALERLGFRHIVYCIKNYYSNHSNAIVTKI